MLPLAFAGILAGSLSLLAGITGHSYPEVIKGEMTPFVGFLKGPSDPAVNGGPKLAEPSLTNTGEKSAPQHGPPKPTTFAKASGTALFYSQTKRELESYLKRKLTRKEERELVTYSKQKIAQGHKR